MCGQSLIIQQVPRGLQSGVPTPGCAEAQAQFKRSHKNVRKSWDLPENFPNRTVLQVRDGRTQCFFQRHFPVKKKRLLFLIMYPKDLMNIGHCF